MSAVIVPLYIYPAPAAWDPLYEAITSNPNVNFIVVVNPHSGPGAGPEPDGNYTREIPHLNTYGNVQTLGYVATGYAGRDLAAVKQDIQTYSQWRTNAKVPGLSVEGIFFDETPSQYDDASANFLHEAQVAARQADGFGTRSLLINNPGTTPDARYLDGPNMTVVFEGTYDTYQLYGFSNKIRMLATTPKRGVKTTRENFVAIMHSIPEEMAGDGAAMKKLAQELRGVAAAVYATDLDVDYYSGFGPTWKQFVAEMN